MRVADGCGWVALQAVRKRAGVSDVAVLQWVRAEALPEPEVRAAVVTVEVDEMWQVLNESLPSSGSGTCMTWISGAPW